MNIEFVFVTVCKYTESNLKPESDYLYVCTYLACKPDSDSEINVKAAMTNNTQYLYESQVFLTVHYTLCLLLVYFILSLVHCEP